MPENEFEKQVKELMEQFHIAPAAPVWEKIKKRITEKKRRIWPVFFLLASIIIVSGYFFYADVKHSNQNIKTAQQPINNPTLKQDVNNNTKQEKNNNSKNQVTHPSVIENPIEKNPHAMKNHYQNNATVFIHHHLIIKNNLHHLENKNVSELAVHKQATEPNSSSISNEKNLQPQTNPSHIIANNTSKNVHEVTDTSANKSSQSSTLPTQHNAVSTNTQSANDSLQAIANNIVKSEPGTSTIINKEVAANNETQNKKASHKKIKNNKWLFGITGMYGNSNITDNLTSISSNKSLSQSVYLNNPGTTFSNNSVSLKNPYSTNNAYNFGVVVQRRVSKKSAINTGLNFIHLSSKNTTAISIDSFLIAVVSSYQSNNAGSFYRVGTAKTYVNNFNFIEIPVTFQSNIFSIKNFSLLYDAGFSVRRLLSSKSLIYNSKNNSFFSNDDLLRRTQFQINAGLNFQLHTKAGNFLLGPNLEYSLSTYLKKNDYDKLHFINYGINASWLFNKK